MELAGDVEGQLGGLEGAGADFAGVEIVNGVGAPPQAAVIENDDVPLGHDFAQAVIDGGGVGRAEKVGVAGGDAVAEEVGVALGVKEGVGAGAADVERLLLRLTSQGCPGQQRHHIQPNVTS
jgi:hypothetical protein